MNFSMKEYTPTVNEKFIPKRNTRELNQDESPVIGTLKFNENNTVFSNGDTKRIKTITDHEPGA